MSGGDHNQGEGRHEPTDYNGRTVCTCGDFNCASLDAARDLTLREITRALSGEVAS